MVLTDQNKNRLLCRLNSLKAQAVCLERILWYEGVGLLFCFALFVSSAILMKEWNHYISLFGFAVLLKYLYSSHDYCKILGLIDEITEVLNSFEESKND